MADSKPGQDLPRMVPDRDDIRKRRPVEPPPTRPGNGGGGDDEGGSGAGAGVWIALAVLFIGVLGLGLLAYGQHQSLAAYDERLQLADERIVDLERAMTQTDESVAMNETAINARFNTLQEEDEFQMSEIRKLWAVGNERNRDWIEENQAAVTDLRESLETQAATLASLESSVGDQTATIESIQGRLDSLAEQAGAIETVQADLQAAEAELAELSESLEGFDPQDIDERLISLTLAQENLMLGQGELTDEQDSLARQVESLDQTIDSIDSGRLETNRRLVALSEQVQAMEDRVSALGGE